MTALPSSLSIGEESDEDRRVRIHLFLRQLKRAAPTHAVVGGISAWLVWRHTGAAAIWWWYGLLIVIVSVRHLGTRVDVSLLSRVAVQRLQFGQVVLAGLTGAMWGLLPWIGYEGRDPYLDFYLAATVVGMSAGGAASLSPLRGAFAAYAGAALGLFALNSLRVGGEVYWAGGFTALFYLLVLLGYDRTSRQTLMDAIQLRRENAGLVGQLREEKRLVEDALRAKSMFLAGVGHDLRHPLHALRLYLGYLDSLCRDELAPPRFSQVVQRMDFAIGGMSETLMRLIELSRLDDGRVRPILRELPLREVADCCRVRFSAEAQRKGLRLRFAATRCVVTTDVLMLQSIVDNLVANAVRFTERGGVLVGVRRRAGSLVLEVRDSGVGIADAHLSRIFEPYWHFDDRRASPPRDRDRDNPSSGLGLALVERYCDVLGHTVDVRSTPGRGTLVSVILSKASAALPPSPGKGL